MCITVPSTSDGRKWLFHRLCVLHTSLSRKPPLVASNSSLPRGGSLPRRPPGTASGQEGLLPHRVYAPCRAVGCFSANPTVHGRAHAMCTAEDVCTEEDFRDRCKTCGREWLPAAPSDGRHQAGDPGWEDRAAHRRALRSPELGGVQPLRPRLSTLNAACPRTVTLLHPVAPAKK